MRPPRCARRLLALAGAALLCGTARADTLVVPVDHATIQQAVDAARAGDEIVVLAGIHEGPVTVDGKSDLVLRGNGKAILRGAHLGSGILVLGSSDVRIEGLTLERWGAIAIWIVGSGGGVVVRNCRVTAAWSGVQISRGTDLDVLIEDCAFERISYSALHANLDGSSRLSLERCSFVGTAFDGGSDLNATSTVRIQGGSGHLLRDNRLQAPGETALLVEKASSISISSNRIEGSLLAGIAIDTCTDVTIERNTIRNFRRVGIRLDKVLSAAVHDNVLLRGQGDGIVVSKQDAGGVLNRNVLRSVTGAGLVVRGTGTIASENRVTRGAWEGVGVEAQGGLLLGNSVRAARRVGLHLWPAAAGNHLGGNRVLRSRLLDLYDQAPGANTIADDNSFGTVGR